MLSTFPWRQITSLFAARRIPAMQPDVVCTLKVNVFGREFPYFGIVNKTLPGFKRVQPASDIKITATARYKPSLEALME
jgi:hypothetical protein